MAERWQNHKFEYAVNSFRFTMQCRKNSSGSLCTAVCTTLYITVVIGFLKVQAISSPHTGAGKAPANPAAAAAAEMFPPDTLAGRTSRLKVTAHHQEGQTVWTSVWASAWGAVCQASHPPLQLMCTGLACRGPNLLVRRLFITRWVAAKNSL